MAARKTVGERIAIIDASGLTPEEIAEKLGLEI